MSREHKYRRYAAEMIELASRAGSTADKRRLLAMAEAWLDLTDRAQGAVRSQAQRLKEHPLLVSKLGSKQREAE